MYILIYIHNNSLVLFFQHILQKKIDQRCYSALHTEITGDDSGILHKANHSGRNAFMCYLLNCFQQVVLLYFLWGLPTSKGVCLPCSDESCRTKSNVMYYMLQVFLHLATLLVILLVLLLFLLLLSSEF